MPGAAPRPWGRPLQLERFFEMDPISPSVMLTSGPTSVGTADPAPDDRQLVDQLVTLWRSHQERGLQVRWEMGALLNRHLGPPARRLAHGKQVLKTAAKEMQTAESELSRMRWFASLFESAEDFQAKHPGARSWTKVKKLLPGLIAAHKGSKKESPSRKKKAATVGGLRSLNNATRWLRLDKTDLDDATREKMLKAITSFMEAVSERLQIRLKIESEGDA